MSGQPINTFKVVFNCTEINEDCQLKTSRSYLYRAFYSKKGVNCHHLHFRRDWRQVEEWENFTLQKKEGLGVSWQ